MCAVASNCKLSLALNYHPPHKRQCLLSRTWDLPAYFSLVLMGVSMYKSSPLPPVSMVEQMPRELSAVLLLDWFQMIHKANLWVWARSLSTLCASGFINTHGTSCLICCPRTSQKPSSHCAPLHPLQAMEKHFSFSHTSLTYSIFLDISRST